MPLTVLVADPDDRAAVAFAAALRGTEFSYLGAVSNGKALLDALFTKNPWAVALDLGLPDHPAAPNIGWSATVPQIREIAPAVRMLITFRPEFGGLVHGALKAGARSFAEKPFLRDEVLAGLRHLTGDQLVQRFYARSRRIPRALTLRYRPAGAGSTSITRIGVARNISETGIMAGVGEKLAARSVVSVEMDLPDRTTIRGRGQVVRESPAAAGRAQEYGIAIFEMETAHRSRLRDFIGRVLADDTEHDLPKAPGTPSLLAAR